MNGGGDIEIWYLLLNINFYLFLRSQEVEVVSGLREVLWLRHSLHLLAVGGEADLDRGPPAGNGLLLVRVHRRSDNTL